VASPRSSLNCIRDRKERGASDDETMRLHLVLDPAAVLLWLVRAAVRQVRFAAMWRKRWIP
jgi:hypothetical protein